ncbi:TBCD protein [Hysterangium stoloniferum]|nr:TBCD protein [Hysterangium stoloniferum]
MEDDEKFLATFERAPEFFETLNTFLLADLNFQPTVEEERAEILLLNKLIIILEEYHEQAYLLDPFLERMVTPIVEVFKTHAAEYIATYTAGNKPMYSPERLTRLTVLLYTFIKCRGRKTIVNFFPHQVADLSIALDYLIIPDGPAQSTSQWPLRYIVLLWLSLICMIPFDLVKFDKEITSTDNAALSTAHKVESIANDYLSRAGLEREAAAILLSKLYTREDTSSLLEGFISRSISWIEANPNYFKTIGTLHVFCEIIKSGIPVSVIPHLTSIHRILQKCGSNQKLQSNTFVRRYNIKLEGRLAVGILPPRRSAMSKGRALQPDAEILADHDANIIPDDIDIPDEVESSISTMLEGLQDKDTAVRYSAAKHLSRITERLPSFLAEQILDNVLQLFSVHSSPSQKMEDLPAVAEPIWHGACLACAEMARRGLIPQGRLGDLLEWLQKARHSLQALLFDIRKGAHSVGASVRDAAAYVLWALARAHDAFGLRPYALSLAQRLVPVSLYDREIHIRRAASAAFQENVGRLSIFPHGIDIIRKTDFFAVGIRKNSFLVAAPQVAEHDEYRLALLNHLASKTIIHWDPVMRILGAESLRAICELDLKNLGPRAEEKMLELLGSIDSNDVHGGILGLSQLAASYKAAKNCESERLRVFQYLARIPPSLLHKHHNDQLLGAACLLISNTLSLSALQSDPSTAFFWRTTIDQGLRHRSTDVQEAAAIALQATSTLTDFLSTYLNDFQKAPPAFQQSISHALGLLSYDKHENAIKSAVACLLDSVDPNSKNFIANVEARRNCFLAMPKLLQCLNTAIPKILDTSTIVQMFQACLKGMEDYSVDERGDVGSWIRVASIRGLSSIIGLLFDISSSLDSFGSLLSWLPPTLYHQGIGAILKQGVERLDNVRRQAGESFLVLLQRQPPGEEWAMDGYSLLSELFLQGELIGWNDGPWLFPKAVRLLEIKTYRKLILHGLVLSVGSKTDATQRPVAICLANFANSLPLAVDDDSGLDVVGITQNILELSRRNLSSNQIVIPVLQTLDILIDAGVFVKLCESPRGVGISEQVLEMATRNVERLKNIQRIIASMKIVNGLLGVQGISRSVPPFLSQFLLHPFPKVRSETSEHLYLVMQAKDLGFETEEAEDILLETDWSILVSELEPKVNDLIRQLQSVN